MEHLMDIDRLVLEALGAADRKHLLNQSSDTFDAIENQAAILLRPCVGREHRGEQLGGAFDSGKRVFNFMREAGRRELEDVIAGVERAFGTALMRQVM